MRKYERVGKKLNVMSNELWSVEVDFLGMVEGKGRRLWKLRYADMRIHSVEMMLYSI